MKEIILCEVCKQEMGIAPGIGPVCGNSDCEVIDGLPPTKEQRKEIVKKINQLRGVS